MLTKQDLEQIGTIVQQKVDLSIKTAFEDFYDHFFEPHVTESAQQHREIINEIVKMKKEIKVLQEDTSEIKEYIEDHDTRIKTLERSMCVKH